jgi:hypothetical protein
MNYAAQDSLTRGSMGHPDHKFLSLLQDVTFRPIFIMGDHRSGTTLLYKLLDETGGFNVVRAYHIICYPDLLANHLAHREAEAKAAIQTMLTQAEMADRRLDQVPVSPDLPEEYGFLLSGSRRPRLTAATLPRFVEACKKVQYISDGARPLLLKNPWDFSNFIAVKQAFPDARFIFLHRHPLHVINSQIVAARTLYAGKSHYHALLEPAYDALWRLPVRLNLIRSMFSSRLELGLRIASRHVVRTTNYFLAHVAELDPQDHMEIKYEELCADPAGTLGSVLNFVGVSTNNLQFVHSAVRPRNPALLPEVMRRAQAIIARLQPYLAYCHYDSVQQTALAPA